MHSVAKFMDDDGFFGLCALTIMAVTGTITILGGHKMLPEFSTISLMAIALYIVAFMILIVFAKFMSNYSYKDNAQTLVKISILPVFNVVVSISMFIAIVFILVGYVGEYIIEKWYDILKIR